MNQSSAASQSSDIGFCAWIAFWAELGILGGAAVLGATFASADSAPGDDTCGLLLSLAAIALAFMLLKRRFDGGAGDCGGFLLVDDLRNLLAVIVVFTVLGLTGLFVAAGYGDGGLHDAGVALFVTSALLVFLSLKHVFDTLDRRR
ncbi:MAG: hypothetical protein ACHQC9_00985 [Alphaproteobacteria bacterium]